MALESAVVAHACNSRIKENLPEREEKGKKRQGADPVIPGFFWVKLFSLACEIFGFRGKNRLKNDNDLPKLGQNQPRNHLIVNDG
jgi:hypothetical protein